MGRREPDSGPSGEAPCGSVLSLCHLSARQLQNEGRQWARCPPELPHGLTGSGAQEPHVKCEAARKRGTVTALVLGLLKMCASDTTRISRENPNAAAWSGQTDKTTPAHIPSSFPKVPEQRESGEGREGERRGSHFLRVCYVPGAVPVSPLRSRQGRQSRQVEDLLSNSDQNELYKETPKFPALSQRMSLSFPLPPYLSLSPPCLSLPSSTLSPSHLIICFSLLSENPRIYQVEEGKA